MPPLPVPRQAEELTLLFEEHGARRDWLDAITTLFDGGRRKRGYVARQLKALGLKRGGLTSRQVNPYTIPPHTTLCL